MPTSLRSLLSSGAGITPIAQIASVTSHSWEGQIFGSQSIIGLNINTMSTVMSLTGKFCISSILVNAASFENPVFRFVIIVDGITVADQQFTDHVRRQHGTQIFGKGFVNSPFTGVPIICENSFQLRLQSTGKTDASVNYIAIPIK